MHIVKLATAFAAVLICGLCCADGASRNVSARDIPPPAGASAALQAAIAATPPQAPSAAPADEQAWRALIAAREQASPAPSAALAESLSVSYRPDRIAGVDVFHVEAASTLERNLERLFLYVHGGAYVFGRGEHGLGEAILIAARLRIPVLSIDYRMPPDHPFPAAIEDVDKVYRYLLEGRGSGSIILGGTSAGGGLALAAGLHFKAEGLALPGAIYAGTPWSDLTKTGDSLYTNEGLDRVLPAYEGMLEAAAKLYAGGRDLDLPLLSPVYGNFADFPPTILVTGTRDLFLSDVARTHRKLRAAGAVADLHVYEGMSHAGYALSADTPESDDMYAELGRFVDAHLP